MLKSALITVLVLFAHSAQAQLECSGSGDQQTCVSLPAEAPETVAVRSQTTQAPSMITKTETSGLAAPVGDELTASPLSAANMADLRLRAVATSSLGEAARAQGRLRFVETFLQSGFANGTDLTVAISRTKVPPRTGD